MKNSAEFINPQLFRYTFKRNYRRITLLLISGYILFTTSLYADSESKIWLNIPFKNYSEGQLETGDDLVTNKFKQRLQKKSDKANTGKDTKLKQKEIPQVSNDSTYDENYSTGYIGKWEYLDKDSPRHLSKNQTIAPKPTDVDNIIKVGLSVLGNKYHYGGSNPYVANSAKNYGYGIDCSAFVKFCYQYGANITFDYRSTSQFLPNLGREVTQQEMKAGDIIMFSNSTSPSSPVCHTGIYLGDKKVLHAGGENSKGSIKVETLKGEVGSYRLYNTVNAVKAIKRVIE